MKKLALLAVALTGLAVYLLRFQPAQQQKSVPEKLFENLNESLSPKPAAPGAKDSPLPAAQAPAPSPQGEPAPEGFAKLLQQTENALPTLADTQALAPGEAHHTPAILFKAGEAIGELTEAISKDPSLAPHGLAFYGKCARREDLATAVRALCLGHLRELAEETGARADEHDISPEIRRLTDKLGD